MAGLEIKSTTAYQNGNYPFPKDDISPKEKNAAWGKKFCEAIYAAWVSDGGSIPFSTIDELEELRLYGAGKQSISKYQDILLSESDEGGELQGYFNVNWDIFSVMPKFKHIVRAMMEEQEHAIIANAIDPNSIDEKKKTILQKWFKARYKDTINDIRAWNKADAMDEWLPESLQELQLYQSMGGLRLAKEMEIEEALNYTFYISDWAEIKRKMIDDLADINCAALKDYTDSYTSKAKIRYVDPLRLIMQYSRHWDHRNSEYAGELVSESISNVRKNTDIPEDILKSLAQFYNGRGRNPNISSWAESSSALGHIYDDFQVDVLDCEWFSINSRYTTTRKNERGEEFTYESDWGKTYDTSTRKTSVQKYKTVYRCKWIVGTNYVYDFGIQYDIPRPGKKEVELSYKFYQLPGRSIVSLAVPNLDQIQLTWLKLQNALAMSANSGIAVEYTSLMNMKLGADKMDPIDILALRRDTGDLFYKLTTHTGRPNVQGGMRPVQELVGGIGPQLDEFVKLFELNLNFIRDLTGINQIADASTPDPNQSVGGSEMAIAATNKAIRPIYSAYIRLKELSARSCTIRIQNLVKHDRRAYNVYIPVVGEIGVKMLEFDAENIDADYHIKIVARPTEQRKNTILQAATQAMQPDKDGYTGLEYRDFLLIERLLDDGNLKYAEQYLTYRSKTSKEKQIELQRENMELNQQQQQEIERIKAEEQRNNMRFETDEKIRFEMAKADIANRSNILEYELKKDLASTESKLNNQIKND